MASQMTLFEDQPAVIESRSEMTRNDGSIVAMAHIRVGRKHRYIRVDQLGEVPPPRQKPATAKRYENRGETPKRTTAKPTPQKSPTPPAVESVDTDRQYEIAVVDYLNILIRAWHVGEKSDVHAVRGMLSTVAKAIGRLQPRHVLFAMDAGYAHRSRLLPQYKAHRPDTEPALRQQIELGEQAINAIGFPVLRVDGFESDDVIASVVEANSGRCVVLSSDKDLLALSGKAGVFHPWKGGEFVTAKSKLGIDPGQVWDYLALMGDASDGIPGVSGIGKKTAAELLQKWGNLEAIIAAAQQQIIPGAKGRNLRDGQADAYVCRDVIELRSTLPLPDWSRWSVRSTWQNELQSLGLGAVTASLGKWVDNRPAESSSVPDKPFSEWTTDEKWSSDEAKRTTCWHVGREAATTGRSCNWKHGTIQRAAWMVGFHGGPLSEALTVQAAEPVEDEPAEAIQGGLF